MSTPSFGLIIVGDEILSGKRTDKHLPKTIEMLAARGLSLSWSVLLGDDRERLTQTLRTAFASSDVVFCCGGIGATPDDHTRQAAAAALGEPLALHPQARELIMERVRQMAADKGITDDPDHPDTVHRLNMGVFPASAQIVPNPYNQIPGFWCTGPGGARIYFVPGFPVMAHPMIEWALDTHCRPWHRHSAWLEKSVVVFGSMEASLTPLMVQIESQHPVKVFSLPSVDHPQHGRHIELGVKGEPSAVEQAYAALMHGLQAFEVKFGPELVRQ
jgi:molybdopterin-biosynthesis enzyme MoeA-like protein